MARVLVIPDLHLKTWVLEHGMEVADKLFCDRVILLGDYFDDWVSSVEDYRKMVDKIKEVMRKNPGRIIPLYGNHELSYMGYKCSGYKEEAQPIVDELIDKDERFRWCWTEDEVLYSHAGICAGWLEYNKLMTRGDYKRKMGKTNGARMCEEAMLNLDSLDQLAQVGPYRGGSHLHPSLAWADMQELLADRAGKFTQIVGHTPVQQIEFYDHVWFTDVYSNDNESDEFLVVVDGEPRVVHYNELIKGEINV